MKRKALSTQEVIACLQNKTPIRIISKSVNSSYEELSERLARVHISIDVKYITNFAIRSHNLIELTFENLYGSYNFLAEDFEIIVDNSSQSIFDF